MTVLRTGAGTCCWAECGLLMIHGAEDQARAPGGRTRIPDTSLQPTYSQHIMEVLAISALLEDVLHAQENVPQVIVSWEFRLGDFPSCHILQTETHLGRGSQESQLGSPTI